MQEFFEKLEEAKALCRLERAVADDPAVIRTLNVAITEIDEIIRMARENEAARTSRGGGRAASLWPQLLTRGSQPPPS